MRRGVEAIFTIESSITLSSLSSAFGDLSTRDQIEVLDCLAVQALRCAAVLKRRSNNQAAISSLPVEVLTYIFHHTLIARHHWPVQALQTLSQVCYDWRRVILDTPSLWNDVQDGDEAYLTTIIKSEEALLDITYSGHQELDIFLERIKPTQNRWRSFTFYSQGEHDRQRGGEELCGPRLRVLTIHGNQNGNGLDTSSEGYMELKPTSSPHLCHLESHSIDIRFPADSPLPRLQVLCMAAFSNTPATYKTILGLVQNSPSLCKLYLSPEEHNGHDDTEDKPDWHKATEQFQHIGHPEQLPLLQELSIIGVPEVVVIQLLTHVGVRLEHLFRLVLRLEHPSGRILQLLSAESDHPVASSLRKICKAVPNLWLSASLQSWGGLWCRSFEFGGYPHGPLGPDSPEWMVDVRIELNLKEQLPHITGLPIFDFPGIAPISLSLDVWVDPDDLTETDETTYWEALETFARATPSVHSLAVEGDASVSALEALANKTWMWPCLRHIQLSDLGASPLELLAEIKKQRSLASGESIGVEDDAGFYLGDSGDIRDGT